MWVERIDLTNFRNFSKQTINFSRKINLIIGDNAQGKTNVIEAVYLLATAKSFRTNKDSDLINWSSSESVIKGKSGPNEVKIVITEVGKKAFVNNHIKSKATLVGLIPVVVFSPESLRIISDSPDYRRKFLDQILSTTNKNYLYNLSRFNKILRERNRLLWLIKQGSNHDLSVWDKQVASVGSFIWWERLKFVDKGNSLLKQVSSRISSPRIRIEYKPLPTRVESERDIRKIYDIELVKRKDADIDRLATTFGPHRDDFKIIFETIDKEKVFEKEIGVFGSRGEQRIATLALKLVEVEYIDGSLGQRPTLLLDDILSEFDKTNRDHIIATLPRQQSIITATTTDLLPKELLDKIKIFEVAGGEIREV